MTAESYEVTGFQASNGSLDRNLRQSSIQPSYRLRGKGDSNLPTNHTSAMVDL